MRIQEETYQSKNALKMPNTGLSYIHILPRLVIVVKLLGTSNIGKFSFLNAVERMLTLCIRLWVHAQCSIKWSMPGWLFSVVCLGCHADCVAVFDQSAFMGVLSHRVESDSLAISFVGLPLDKIGC